MKKFNGRLIVSAILAAAMLSVSAVTVSADEYADPVAPSTKTPVKDVSADKEVAVKAVATADDVKKALENVNEEGVAVIEATTDANGGLKLQEGAWTAIANSDTPVVIEVTTTDGTSYEIEIDPASITDPEGLAKIDIGIDVIIDTDEGDSVNKVDVPEGSVILKPHFSGEIGATLGITVPFTGDTALVFHVSDNGEVTPVAEENYVMNDDDTVTVYINSASAYIITDVDILDEDETFDDDDEEDDDYFEDDDDDDDDAYIEDEDDDDDDDATIVSDDTAKTNDTPIIISNESKDADGNPGTGVGLALGALAASAAAVLVAKKRK
ncbi:MAG: hypothetical protein IK093_06895 [Ruminiclostridium sp.]|nr:hypothetical protein [Ruminiclostridium sp.]